MKSKFLGINYDSEEKRININMSKDKHHIGWNGL